MLFKLRLVPALVVTLALSSLTFGSALAGSNGQASNGNGDLIHIGPNPAACSGPFSGADSGVVIVDSNVGQSTLDLNVSFQYALPNQTYVVDIRCVGKIGSVTTDAQGTGTAQISLPIPQAPTGAFYLDVSVAPPGGAGSGGYGDTFIAGPFSLN